MPTIAILKESLAGEQRVALLPQHVAQLSSDYTCLVEQGAGQACHLQDEDYRQAGALVMDDFQQLITEADIILQVKRCATRREQQLTEYLRAGQMVLGFLGPANQSPRRDWSELSVKHYSFDELVLEQDDPKNVLAAMSRITGELALLDALEKCQIEHPKTLLVLGTGVAGMAAIISGVARDLLVTGVARREQYRPRVTEVGAIFKCAPSNATEQAAFLHQLLINADLVIATARVVGKHSPRLVTMDDLQAMRPGAAVIDLSLTEGGNVAGSEHDKTHVLGNNVIVSNSSGYPKLRPLLASHAYGDGVLLLLKLLLNEGEAALASCF